jgi:hypothetical protein
VFAVIVITNNWNSVLCAPTSALQRSRRQKIKKAVTGGMKNKDKIAL